MLRVALRGLLAIGLPLMWAGCAPTAAVVKMSTDIQIRGNAPALAGTWLVVENGQPRRVWSLKQTGQSLTGTIEDYAADVTGATPSPQPIAGSLVGVGEGWQGELTQPEGVMTFTTTGFEFCPLIGGVGGCRTGSQSFSNLASPTPKTSSSPSPKASPSPSH